MRVVVDQERCQGHARCYALVPEWFELDAETGLSAAKADQVPPEFLDRVQAAVSTCPERALTVER